MSTVKICGTCGKPLAVDAPQGICPECLMKAGFGSAGGSETAGTSGFVPPTVETMAKLFPQFEIIELIGKGGMGAVYKARQPGLDRLVALSYRPFRSRNTFAIARDQSPSSVGDSCGQP